MKETLEDPWESLSMKGKEPYVLRKVILLLYTVDFDVKIEKRQRFKGNRKFIWKIWSRGLERPIGKRKTFP